VLGPPTMFGACRASETCQDRIVSSSKHIHVRREWMVCKFWLMPVALAANHGFPVHEVNVIRSYWRLSTAAAGGVG
jgi:Domain of unknown function (DUF4160)